MNADTISLQKLYDLFKEDEVFQITTEGPLMVLTLTKRFTVKKRSTANSDKTVKQYLHQQHFVEGIVPETLEQLVREMREEILSNTDCVIGRK